MSTFPVPTNAAPPSRPPLRTGTGESDASNSPYEEGARSEFGTNLLSALRSGTDGMAPEELAETVSPEGDGTQDDVSPAALSEGIDAAAGKYESAGEPVLDVRAGVLAAVQLLQEHAGESGKKASTPPSTEADRGLPGRAFGLEVARAAGAEPQAPTTLGTVTREHGPVKPDGAPFQAQMEQLRGQGGSVRVISIETEAIPGATLLPGDTVEGEHGGSTPSRAGAQEIATRLAGGRTPVLEAVTQSLAASAPQRTTSEQSRSEQARIDASSLGAGADGAEPTSHATGAAPAGASFRAPLTQGRVEAAPVHAQPSLPEPAPGPGEGRTLPPRPSSVVMEITPEGHGEPIAVRVRVFGESASARILRADPAVAQALMDGEGELVRTLEQSGFRDAQLTRNPDLMIATASRGEGAGTSQGGSERGDGTGDRQRPGGGPAHQQQQQRDQREHPDTFLPDFREALGS